MLGGDTPGRLTPAAHRASMAADIPVRTPLPRSARALPDAHPPRACGRSCGAPRTSPSAAPCLVHAPCTRAWTAAHPAERVGFRCLICTSRLPCPAAPRHPRRRHPGGGPPGTSGGRGTGHADPHPGRASTIPASTPTDHHHPPEMFPGIDRSACLPLHARRGSKPLGRRPFVLTAAAKHRHLNSKGAS
jgi:hypothetical protein